MAGGGRLILKDCLFHARRSGLPLFLRIFPGRCRPGKGGATDKVGLSVKDGVQSHRIRLIEYNYLEYDQISVVLLFREPLIEIE